MASDAPGSRISSVLAREPAPGLVPTGEAVIVLPPSGALRAGVFGITRVSWTGAGLQLDIGGRKHAFISADRLFDDADGQFDPVSGQRLYPAVTPPRRIASVRSSERSILIAFDNGSERAWTYAALARGVQPPDSGARELLAFSRLIHIDADAFLTRDDVCRKALAAVARSGACLLRDYQGGPGGVEAIVARFGYIRQTNYGRLFDVREAKVAANLAFTDRGLAPHTDNPYRQPPPGLQILHCIKAADRGGQSLLLDGFDAARGLLNDKPEMFEKLAATPVRFAWADPSVALEAWAPVIERDACGALSGLRVNDRSMRPPDDARWREAYRELMGYLEEPARQHLFTLKAGDVLMFDNRRMLHGRTKYSGGARWLQGCYADMDGLLGRLSALEQHEAQSRASSALAQLEGPSAEDSYGEGLSLRQHSLQSAALAGAAGLPPAMIAAALLHDVGWSLGGVHEDVGAAFTEQRFGPAVGQPIRLHVDAKRYLVAVDPDYRSHLSTASLVTLAEQGGPLSPECVRRFEQTPGFADAVALRRIDDRAKDPLMLSLDLEDYRDLLVALALDAVRRELA